MKKEPVAEESYKKPDPPLPKRQFAIDMDTSYTGVEDEFGSEFCR